MNVGQLIVQWAAKFFGAPADSTESETHAVVERFGDKTFSEHLAAAKGEAAGEMAALRTEFEGLKGTVETLKASVLEKDAKILELSGQLTEAQTALETERTAATTETASLNLQIAGLLAKGKKEEGQEIEVLTIGKGPKKETVVVLPESDLGKMFTKKRG